MLAAAMSATAKSFEERIASLVRMLGTEHDGETLNTVSVLKRTLASRNLTFTDLGDGIEKLATGGLTQGEMERIRDSAYAKGVADAKRESTGARAVFGLRPDGSQDWEEIALHCQQEKSRLEAKHHQFVDDMASRLTWGQEPSEKQGKYLLSLFRRVGGRIA
jgi:hypothetical protein